jgi:L-cystine uptake protein TcyP (sodium:dicarboxylate symporter family)
MHAFVIGCLCVCVFASVIGIYSWGTKGQDDQTHASGSDVKPEISMEDQLKIFRTKTVLAYATINVAIVVVSVQCKSKPKFIHFLCCFYPFSYHGIWILAVVHSFSLWYNMIPYCDHITIHII